MLLLRKSVCILYTACAVGASSSQRKYDGSTLSYDPKGRIFQVEYATEATRRGRTVLGVCGEDCVALVTRDPSPKSSCRAVKHEGGVWAVDTHVGIAAAGLRSDIQYVVDCARTWCSEHQFVFGAPMPCNMLARRLADLIHSCTNRGGKRPLAVDVLVGGVDEHAGASLHRVQATGAFQRYHAVAAGSGGAAAIARLAAAASEEGDMSQQGGKEDGGREEGHGTFLRKSEEEEEEEEEEERNTHRRHRSLAPEHRAALKRAVSALWDTSISSGGGGGVGEDGEEESRQEGEKAAGGLRASELTAVIYGAPWRKPARRASSSSSPPSHTADGGGGGWGLVDEEVAAATAATAAPWEQGLGCSRQDFESVLLELAAEEREEDSGSRR